jgi:hypothetical protein
MHPVQRLLLLVANCKLAAMSTQPQTGGRKNPVATIANGFVVVHRPSIHRCQFIQTPATNWNNAISQNEVRGMLAQKKRKIIKGSARTGKSHRMTVKIESPLPPHAKANSPQRLNSADNTKATMAGNPRMLLFFRAHSPLSNSGSDTSGTLTRLGLSVLIDVL